MVQMSIDEIITLLNTGFLNKVTSFRIKLIYIFGSYAKGNNTNKSDLDIAILLEDGYNPFDKIEILGVLSDTLRRDDIDLVLLNEANGILKHQVIKYGKLLYMDDEETKVFFEARVLKEYMDAAHFRKTQLFYIGEWIKNELEG